MTYAVKMFTSGENDVVELKEEFDWRDLAKKIGCDYIETVRPVGLKEPYMLIVDEEGLLKDKPLLNFFGSWLYGTHEHGQPIVGDALIMKEIMTEDGPTIGGLTRSEAEVIMEYVISNWQKTELIEKKFAWRLKRA